MTRKQTLYYSCGTYYRHLIFSDFHLWVLVLFSRPLHLSSYSGWSALVVMRGRAFGLLISLVLLSLPLSSPETLCVITRHVSPHLPPGLDWSGLRFSSPVCVWDGQDPGPLSLSSPLGRSWNGLRGGPWLPPSHFHLWRRCRRLWRCGGAYGGLAASGWAWRAGTRTGDGSGTPEYPVTAGSLFLCRSGSWATLCLEGSALCSRRTRRRCRRRPSSEAPNLAWKEADSRPSSFTVRRELGPGRSKGRHVVRNRKWMNITLNSKD